jgi:hypothetical protein
MTGVVGGLLAYDIQGWRRSGYDSIWCDFDSL